MDTYRKEASVTQAVITQLNNLGWNTDEKNPACNVFQQRAKTTEQKKKLRGKSPDFVLYQEGTSIPIAVIEAKRPRQSLPDALNQAEEKYAIPLEAPLIFAYNDTYVATRYLHNQRALKIDGEDVRQFVNHYTALRFVTEGPEIFSVPKNIQYSREQLIRIFRRAAELLREAGLQAGLERFGAFSDILFLKIMDETCELTLHAGKESPLPKHVRWSYFKDMGEGELHDYLKTVVWPAMNGKYKSIFGEILPIDSPEIMHDIVRELSSLNLLGADTDVKGDAFEYFLKNAYQGLSIKDLGEYFTPRNIARTMVSMVNPQIGEKIYDPFCGTGGFLIESFKYLRIRMKPTTDLERVLRNETVYGSEITSNARIAMMNMILFGDGHSNIAKEDSLANPKRGKFDIVLTNPPYSQTTRHGNLYSVESMSGDAVCIAHLLDSLGEKGRAAFLVKEDFLSEGGAVGKVRDRILKGAKNFGVVSLPRKLFVPYTPTKTSIIYFEKGGHRNTTFFYVVRNVGHTLATRKKSIPANDLPAVLDAFKSERESDEIYSCIVDNSIIESNDNSLWVHDYLELVPPTKYSTDYLGKFIEESGETVSPREYPSDEFRILGVSNTFGVFENEILYGEQINQNYKRVCTGDLVYNPHRVNVGSIGLVSSEYDGGYVSGIYIVFRSIDKQIPPEYILGLLKSNAYRSVIEAYDTKYGAVRANLNYEQLSRIRVPMLPIDKMQVFLRHENELILMQREIAMKRQTAYASLEEITGMKESSRTASRSVQVEQIQRLMTTALNPVLREKGSGIYAKNAHRRRKQRKQK